MARNEEKAQSMLYRFREAQAAELGLGTRSDRRPRMASACKSLRDCERWRGEILREISRKVSKIQDAGLTDYEVRDLNDEINKLMREKRHWENQIVALGGANYRRNVAMVDDEGKEVPGTKGYKYFGRAKELPGVRELFQGRAKEEEEETRAQTYYKRFTGHGPAYFGDLDEQDGTLIEYERNIEESEWEEMYSNIRETLDLPEDSPIPPMPRKHVTVLKSLESETTSSTDTKRKAPDQDEGADIASDDAAPNANTVSGDVQKRQKTDETPATNGSATDTKTTADTMLQSARAAAAFIPFLSPEELMPPKMPSREEMEAVLLDLRKKALVEEYFGE